MINFPSTGIHKVQTIDAAGAAHGHHKDDDRTTIKLGQHGKTGGDRWHLGIHQKEINSKTQ